MLAITEDAAAAIGGILAAPELPEEAGVRITSKITPTEDGATHAQVNLTVVDAPEQSDEVLEHASVFLEPEAALLLEDKLLDADVVGDEVQFNIREQPQ
jgi:iron-sulfur cluster assembly protein